MFGVIGSKDKELKIFTGEDGGAAHCQFDNHFPALLYVSDWLAEETLTEHFRALRLIDALDCAKRFPMLWRGCRHHVTSDPALRFVRSCAIALSFRATSSRLHKGVTPF